MFFAKAISNGSFDYQSKKSNVCQINEIYKENPNEAYSATLEKRKYEPREKKLYCQTYLLISHRLIITQDTARFQDTKRGAPAISITKWWAT